MIGALLSNSALAGRLLKAMLILPNLYPLVQIAERRFKGEKTGADKKVFVLAAVNIVTDELEKKGFITADMNKGLDKLAGELVDVVVSVMNVMAWKSPKS